MAAPPDVGPDARTDASVIERSWHDPERFGVIFDAYFAEIHGYVARRLDGAAADDIAAETFHAAFRKRKKFDLSRESARPWLYGIATNLIAKHRRSEARRFRALGRLGGERSAGGHEDRVVTRVSAEQMKGRLARGVGDLPADQRDVLLLVVLADLSYEEVAQALDVPYGTVASRFSRARKKLRTALGGVDPMLDQEGPTDG
ncbi:RNA polymerase sigma factor [Actinoallomurus sp. CA-150999]|uniref:RNA polymerase sigma factor n=1 Tax=Actinoallomurus sp. CA-150999 TaxID=3239887 RepID=UPI003D90D185